ncbi:hypothetical protein F8M41_005301 [Gigaspora margarita]|uniref:Uncharacterized protein n=1 Tax=Gigaspora margarita TaxID=4874 RepID=A0A8H4ERS0_GIGMA|nr:hypothetical protein F8M41_005301 [Gigaspora margarita]
MKTSYNLVVLFLFFILLSFLIITVSTELNFNITPDTQHHIFTYSENKQTTTSQLYVKDIQFYDDGTTLIYLVSDSTENCFDHILRIRIIHLNGTVEEINTDLNLSPASYCLFKDSVRGEMVHPILIRPLKQPFILVSYMNQSSNFSENWGTVLNWNGEKLSSMSFEQYTDNIAYRNFIEVNINKELGFLRISARDYMFATHYSVDVNGNLLVLLQDVSISVAYFLASLATADEGYIILYNYSSSLNAIFIDYNKTSTSNPIRIDVPIDINTTINAVHCDAYFGFGHYCIASISKQTNESYYEFLFYTEKLIGSNQLHQLPNNISVSWNVSSTPIGGYIFSVVVNATCFIYIYDVDHYFNNSKVNVTYFNTTVT